MIEQDPNQIHRKHMELTFDMCETTQANAWALRDKWHAADMADDLDAGIFSAAVCGAVIENHGLYRLMLTDPDAFGRALAAFTICNMDQAALRLGKD